MISSFFLYNFHNFLGCKLCLCVNHIRSTIYSQLSMANFLSSFPSINQNLNSLELFTTTKGIRKTTLQTEIPLFALFFFLFLFFNIFKFNTNYKIHKKKPNFHLSILNNKKNSRCLLLQIKIKKKKNTRINFHSHISI